jgi:hypothetical protein
MARRVFIHIGPPKTGTTFLQAAWFQHRDDLARQGVLYPGDKLLDQFRACAVALGKTRVTSRLDSHGRDTWTRLTGQVRDWQGDAIISSEHYSLAGRRNATRVIGELTDLCDELHVVATARDLARQVPAAWQQSVKQGGVESLDEYWRRLADDTGSRFWIGQDLPTLLGRWGKGVPPAQVHVVVHGRPGTPRNLLWERMCQVTGVDPGILRPIRRTNESVGAVNAELLRRANGFRPADVDRRDLAALTKSSATTELLTRAGQPVPITMSATAQKWAVERGRAMADALQSRPYDVVGDLEDLVPDPEPAPGRTPDSVDDAELMESAAPVIAELFAREVRHRMQRRARRRRARRSRAVAARATPVRRLRTRARSTLARLRG